MPKVSVVIPVYNTGSLLDRTLTSVTQQTLADIEIICVDDCSTDNSLAILMDWAQKDSRIRIIPFEQNGGASRARNTGIDESRGEFIYFLDSDDWIDLDYLNAMYSKARETGQNVVLNVNNIKEYEEHGRQAERETWGFKESGYYPTANVQSQMLCVIWTRLYNRDYLVSNNIRFPIIPAGEDIYFTALAEVLQPKSYVFFGPWHHYWQRPGSLFHQQNNSFYYIQSYRLLYRELVARGISLDGLKLFHTGMDTIDSQDKFDLIHSYLQEVGDVIQKHPDNYTVLDNLLFDAIMGSADYATFRAHHHPNLAIDYLRAHIRSKQCHD